MYYIALYMAVLENEPLARFLKKSYISNRLNVAPISINILSKITVLIVECKNV
jgi:hypothetical protein